MGPEVTGLVYLLGLLLLRLIWHSYALSHQGYGVLRTDMWPRGVNVMLQSGDRTLVSTQLLSALRH